MTRDDQLEYLNKVACSFLVDGEPVIFVDTNQKELTGELRHSSRRPEGNLVVDFIDPKLKSVLPPDVYDVNENNGWYGVAKGYEVAPFVVNAVRSWWRTSGKQRYPNPQKFLITTNSPGSIGYRDRLLKLELQKMADELTYPVTVCHMPRVYFKWAGIENRFFYFNAVYEHQNPVLAFRSEVNLVGVAGSNEKLIVRAELDERQYPDVPRVSKKQLAPVNIWPHDFMGEWNYTIAPTGT